MDWMEKIRYLKKRQELKDYDKNKYYIDVSFSKNRWPQGELESIIKPYNYVPRAYIDFIKEFDNIGLSFVGFYGSKGLTDYGLTDYISEFKEYLKEDYFPFGKDPEGGVFAFNRAGEVILFEYNDYEFENPIKLADSFGEFIGEYALGKNGWSGEADNDFYRFLKSLGWV